MLVSPFSSTLVTIFKIGHLLVLRSDFNFRTSMSFSDWREIRSQKRLRWVLSAPEGRKMKYDLTYILFPFANLVDDERCPF